MPQPVENDEHSWWDYYSDQPHRVSGSQKPRSSADNLAEYLLIAGTALLASPALCWRYITLKPMSALPEVKDFVGLSIAPDPKYDDASYDMVHELGVRELLVRVPTWDPKALDDVQRLVERYPRHRFLVNILQNRDSILNPDQWRENLHTIFNRLGAVSSDFQIGNAINRTKWGLNHSGEYLRLLEIAEQVRAECPNVRLVGSSVIDFEPLVTLRTLLNLRDYRLDAVSSLLYVNRRGSPFARQYGIFDLKRKLRLIYAMVSVSNRAQKRLWITEVNWPLLDTKPYTPNSGHPRSTVDEETQARYLKQYYRIAHRTGFVEKVYWWQLINPGYGLVDHRCGTLRKYPAYYALKEIIDGGLSA
ncbi:MAG: hypothetical protein OEU36_05145 [Gammaproteobacteria bacterium]|nr:hypothetical protein [Gammaproteobacteria bacterium]